MSKAQILMHRYFDAAWNQGRKGVGYSDTQLPEHKELIGYVFDLEQRLAAAEAKIPRWIPVGESMPTIAEPYVEYGEWVLGKERYYKVPTICCRTWIDREQNYWEWTAENGEVIDITHWMTIPNTRDAATGAPETERKGE